MTATSHDDPDGALRRKRHHMAGLWAAELLGLIGHAAHDYAHDVAHAHPDDDSLARALAHDLRNRIAMTEIKAKLAHLLNHARQQMRK